MTQTQGFSYLKTTLQTNEKVFAGCIEKMCHVRGYGKKYRQYATVDNKREHVSVDELLSDLQKANAKGYLDLYDLDFDFAFELDQI